MVFCGFTLFSFVNLLRNHAISATRPLQLGPSNVRAASIDVHSPPCSSAGPVTTGNIDSRLLTSPASKTTFVKSYATSVPQPHLAALPTISCSSASYPTDSCTGDAGTATPPLAAILKSTTANPIFCPNSSFVFTSTAPQSPCRSLTCCCIESLQTLPQPSSHLSATHGTVAQRLALQLQFLAHLGLFNLFTTSRTVIMDSILCCLLIHPFRHPHFDSVLSARGLPDLFFGKINIANYWSLLLPTSVLGYFAISSGVAGDTKCGTHCLPFGWKWSPIIAQPLLRAYYSL